MSFVTIRGLKKKYGEEAALAGVDLDLPEGEITALLGPSGCGKTSLLRILAGLGEPDEGKVVMDGTVLNDPRSRRAPEARGIGMVFQDSLLWPHLRVRDNIAFPLGTKGDDPRVVRAAERAEVTEFLDRFPGGLSGGEQRRVAIARATVKEPRLLLMDEPLSGLDANLRVRLLAAIRSIQRELCVTTCYVTHDQEEALGVADRVVVMRSGRILRVGSPEEIYAAPESAFVAGFVGLSSMVGGVVTAGVAKTALGDFPADGATDGPVRLAIRPESVRIEAEGPVAATVEQCAFRGDRWLVTLSTPECELLAFTAERPEIGEEVRLRIDPDPALVTDDEVSP